MHRLLNGLPFPKNSGKKVLLGDQRETDSRVFFSTVIKITINYQITGSPCEETRE